MTNLILTGATPENVATKATNSNALDRSTLNLLGIFGPTDSMSALVRLPGGRVRKVETGQKLGRGRIVAIDAEGLMMVKNGRSERIGMPGG